MELRFFFNLEACKSCEGFNVEKENRTYSMIGSFDVSWFQIIFLVLWNLKTFIYFSMFIFFLLNVACLKFWSYFLAWKQWYDILSKIKYMYFFFKCLKSWIKNEKKINFIHKHSSNIHHHSSFNNNLLMIQVHKILFNVHGSLLMAHALAFAHLKPSNQRPWSKWSLHFE
jgi:hypothetical protein